jgi:ribonuclease P protein component
LAVSRNKAKRWIREIVKKYFEGQGFIVVVRSGFLDLGFQEVLELMTEPLVSFKKIKG